MKMGLDADIDNIPFLLYMEQQETANKPSLCPYNSLNCNEGIKVSDEPQRGLEGKIEGH